MSKKRFLKPKDGLQVPDYRKTTTTRQVFFPAKGREVEEPLITYERRALRRGDLVEVGAAPKPTESKAKDKKSGE